jgi:folate-binding protein YgfZ
LGLIQSTGGKSPECRLVLQVAGAILTSTPMRTSQLLGELLSNDPIFARDDAPFRLVRVHGPDAGDFLQRLGSQEVVGLGEGEVRPAAFLDAKGKLLVTCLVFRLDSAFWLEIQAEQAERLVALLERYHFTEKLTIERMALGACFECVTRWSNVPAQDCRAQLVDGKPLLWFGRRGVLFTRSHGRLLQLQRPDAPTPVPMQPLEADRAECLRMLAGLLRVGVETEAATLALEADLDDHVSTTKGCYTGQEIVARIHTYGHVNRKACLLQLASGAPIDAAQPLLEPEDRLAVGRVLHAVPVPGHAARLGIGYLPKDFQAIGTRLVLEDGAAVEVIGYEPLAPLPAQASTT